VSLISSGRQSFGGAGGPFPGCDTVGPNALLTYDVAYAAHGFRRQRHPGHRRERIEAAVVAGGKHASAPCEAWIAADPFKDGFRFLMTAVIYRRAAACAPLRW
jgi:hypothetical protein